MANLRDQLLAQFELPKLQAPTLGTNNNIRPVLMQALEPAVPRAQQLVPQAAAERFRQVVTGTDPRPPVANDLSALSKVSQFALDRDKPKPPEPAIEMDTSLVPVAGAPTLNPSYAKLGTPSMGGVGGGVGGPSLLDKLRAAQQKQLGLMDQERQLTMDAGAAKEGRVAAVADLEEQQAGQERQAAKDLKDAETIGWQKTQEVLDHQQKMVDDLASAKVDPNRAFRDASNGTQALWLLAAAGDGFLRGMNGSSVNPTLDRLDKIIDRDIKAQLDEIENKKASISARQGMVAQMIQVTGSKSQGIIAAQGMMREAAKQSLKAYSDKKGIPELQASTKLLANGIDQRNQAMATGFIKDEYEEKKRAAAAAIAAQRAAENQAWERSLKLMELGQKQDKLGIERLEAEGKGRKDVDERVQKLGTALADPKLQQGRAVTDALSAEVARTKPGEQIEGLGWGSRFVAGMPLGEHVLSDRANVNRQNWGDFMGVLRQMRTGSGGGEKELATILREAEGAKTPAERANVVAKAEAFFQNQEIAHRAAAGPEASAAYDANKQAVGAQMPASVQVKRAASSEPAQPINPWQRK